MLSYSSSIVLPLMLSSQHLRQNSPPADADDTDDSSRSLTMIALHKLTMSKVHEIFMG